jgi:nitrogen fixation NifU-like protein
MMQLESMYQDIILDHYRNPVGKGELEPFDAEVHHVNPTCGDEITLRVRIRQGVIDDVGHVGQGCSISQAAASVMVELVKGRSVNSALATESAFLALMQSRGRGIADEDLLEEAVAFAGVSKYPARVKCALLPWMALKDALLRVVPDDATTQIEEIR